MPNTLQTPNQSIPDSVNRYNTVFAIKTDATKIQCADELNRIHEQIIDMASMYTMIMDKDNDTGIEVLPPSMDAIETLAILARDLGQHIFNMPDQKIASVTEGK